MCVCVRVCVSGEREIKIESKIKRGVFKVVFVNLVGIFFIVEGIMEKLFIIGIRGRNYYYISVF